MIYLFVPLIIILDQLTKYAVVNWVTGDGIAVVPGVLYILHETNTGAAFSMFSGNNMAMLCLTSAITVLIMVYCVKVKPHNRLDTLARAMVLGGALGNIVDRIVRGAVVDFIYFAPIRFPVFNLADSCITVGTAIYLAVYLYGYKNSAEPSVE